MTIRIVAAVAALVSAAVHLYLWLDGVRDQEGIGPLFIVNIVAGVVIAVLLLAWRNWIPLFLVAGFGAATLGAFIISSTVGMYGINTSWDGWDEWTAAAAEVIAIVAGLWGLNTELLGREAQNRRSAQSLNHH